MKDPEYQRKRQEHYQLDQRHHRRSYHDGHRRPRPNDQYETGWFSPSAGYDRRSRRRDHLAHFGFEIDGQTRETIRRIAFSTLVASGLYFIAFKKEQKVIEWINKKVQ